MAWDVVSQTLNTVLPASKINQLYDNFAALAAQNSGAPVVTFPNSILNANAGMASTGVGSFGSVNASSGFRTTGVGSFGSVNASSGFLTTGVGSFGLLHVNSGIRISVSAPATPIADTLYRDAIPRAWVTFQGCGTVAIFHSYNIAAISDIGAGNWGVTFDTAMVTSLNCVTATAGRVGGGSDAREIDIQSHSLNGFCVSAQDIAGTLADVTLMHCLVFGTQ